MREYAKKPENQSRTQDSTPQACRQASIDMILQQQYKERNILRNVENEELIQGKFDIAQCDEIVEDELLQGKFKPAPNSKHESVQLKDNPDNTRLSENLKAGIENLSGCNLNNVKEGMDIFVAPGKEKHLLHEAWHIVQQNQGTMQLQGVNVNNNEVFEKKVDFVGNKAIQLEPLLGIQENDDEKIRKLAYELYKQRKRQGEKENPFEDYVEAKRMLYGGLHGAKIGDKVRYKNFWKAIIYTVTQTNSDNVILKNKNQQLTVNYDTKDYELLNHKTIPPTERAEILGKYLPETTSGKFKKWGLSDQEISAMQNYTTSNYTIINRFLRADKDPEDGVKHEIIDWLSRYCPNDLPSYKDFIKIDNPSITSDWSVAKALFTEFIDTIKSAIQKFPVPKEKIVRRGVTLNSKEARDFKNQHKEGATIVDKGFLSTSYAAPFASDSIIIIKNLPEGHPGRIIAENSAFGPETEMIFPPSTGYTIEKILYKINPAFEQEMKELTCGQEVTNFKNVERIYLCKLHIPEQ